MDLQSLKPQGYIDGNWCGADSGETFAIDNPATGKTIAQMPRMGAAETHRAIDAMAKAFPAWRERTAAERAALLQEWHRRIQEHSEGLAKIMTLEQGKPLAEARGEVGYGNGFILWFAEQCRRDHGFVLPSFKPNTEVRVTREPIGPAALITPWNFPVAMITRKAGAALAAGCPVLMKPAELTPLCAAALVMLAEESGFPAGVINLVTGASAPIGQAMCARPEVRALSFTGSTPVGKLLAGQCAPTLKKLSLELGGNAAFIVFDDADPELAADQAVLSKFRNSGQTCVCANRFFVQDGIYDEFAAALSARVEKMKVGNGLEEGVTQGPLISEAAVAKVKQHIEDAVQRGARILTGGQQPEIGGRFFQPTVLADVPDGCQIDGEETFGPVAPLYRFADEKEVISRANATEMGLASYLCTRDLGRAQRVSRALEAGIIGVNEGIISSETAPFGGVKQSGLGREGSIFGLEEYQEIKYTLIGYPPPPA